ncbi:MAG: fructose-6-phosphate aldolase [Candidatus Woesearchaeota archaeon]
MEFFVDSADIEKIKKLVQYNLCDGVTTNPTLIKQSGKNHEQVIKEISSIVKGPISVETLSENAEGMIKEALEYVKWGKNIVIKIVMTSEGMKAVNYLSKKGIKTNVTLIFSPLQALYAAKSGAFYVSPFLGRLDDSGSSGIEVLKQIKQIFDNYKSTNFEKPIKTKILAASIRNKEHILNSALIGVDCITVPPAILEEIAKHPLTDIGIKKFLDDAKQWK